MMNRRSTSELSGSEGTMDTSSDEPSSSEYTMDCRTDDSYDPFRRFTKIY